jgi:hypothetical protein
LRFKEVEEFSGASENDEFVLIHCQADNTAGIKTTAKLIVKDEYPPNGLSGFDSEILLIISGFHSEDAKFRRLCNHIL